MTRCSHIHRYDSRFQDLPEDQSESRGRHHCAACAYKRGYLSGLLRDPTPSINLDTIPETQAGAVRHKSPLVAWAWGYAAGLLASYKQ